MCRIHRHGEVYGVSSSWTITFHLLLLLLLEHTMACEHGLEVGHLSGN
jgi:hypothetical protein